MNNTEFYPGINYQRLFDAINDAAPNPVQGQMDDIIQIVQQDFASKESNTDCSVEQGKVYSADDMNTIARQSYEAGKSSQLKPVDCSVDGSEAISFGDWIGENEWHWEIDDLLGERWFKNIQSSPYLTTTQLYKLFKTPPNTEQL